MSSNETAYFNGKLPLMSHLLVDGQTPSWEKPCRFLLGLFQDPRGYGIPEQYRTDLTNVRTTFFPFVTEIIVDKTVDDWAASKTRRGRTLHFVPFKAFPHYKKNEMGTGIADATSIRHLVVRFHHSQTQLFTSLDAIAYMFSIADPPKGVPLTPESFFQPLLHELAQFLYVLHPKQDTCPKVLCIVVHKRGDKMQWSLGTSLGRFKPDDDQCWGYELKSNLARAR